MGDERDEILARLLEMARGPGAPLGGVWCDQGRIRIRYLPWGDPHFITWDEAAVMTNVMITPKKPVERYYPCRRERTA